MKRVKRLLYTIASIVLGWLALVVLGAVLPGPIHDPKLAPDRFIHVGLTQGPIHTDFLLPLDDDTRADFAQLGLPETAKWLAVGWGGREFYTTVGDYSDITRDVIWQTLKGDSAVMRFQTVDEFTPERTILLNHVQYDRLRASILADTDLGAPVGGDLLSQGDRYFAAKGNFNLINTCNQWIALSLRRAGHSFGLWTQTGWAVRLSLAIYG